MNLRDLTKRVRQNTRDTTSALFTSDDIKSFIREACDRVKQIPELSGMAELISDNVEVTHLPVMYHYILSLYATSRCFSQDEQHYPAQKFMDEFEARLFALETGINNGDIIITDENGEPVKVDGANKIDAVVNVYFAKLGSDDDEQQA